MKIDVAEFGPEPGDIELDFGIVPGDDQQRAAVVLLEAGWEMVSCSKDNGVRTTYTRSDE